MNGTQINEEWIMAMDEAMRLLKDWHRSEPIMYALKYCAAEGCAYGDAYRTIDGMLRGIRSQAAMNLPKDHEKYMDQQGDEPNKRG